MAAGIIGFSADKIFRFFLRSFIVVLVVFSNNSQAEDVLLTVNVKKPVALTSDKFLSYTLDPTIILTGDALTKNTERNVNMARALAPAYVRIGGPRSNSYTFERTDRSPDEEDPGFTFTEANWIGAHRWANNAGLDVLACIAPQHSEISGREPGWDSRNALDLISFSDHMGFNTSWQLGYECQTRCDVSGIDIGRDVMRLRSMLDAFPRYSRSIIAGPDVVTYRSKQQQQYLQDYLNVAGTALSAITWHPDFASITLDTEGVSMHHDNLAIDRDGLYRVVGRVISKKPLWLAESKPEECKTQFLGALVWTRRLGNAAKLGVQVLMRQPNGSNLFQPTPDYWVSVLHKTLVGREVLDTKIATGNKTHIHFYCQCTKPSAKYEKGSLTIFGINLTPSKIVANLKGVKIKTLHKYILLPGFDAENRMFSETVLLNNEPLSLLNESELPEIKPAISSNSKGVTLKLPSGGIGFWVIPGLKIKSCGGLDEDNSDKMLLKKLTKRLDVAESDEESTNEEDREEEIDEENISGEERRYSSKSNKEKRRRKHRYSEEDDAEKRYRRFEAKMDLERLEKLLRRRDNHEERKSPRGRTAYFGFEERSQERSDMEDEETGEEIRSKLEEYKNRLREYENRKRNESKSRGKINESSDNETIDSEKVVEAMSLISKMENAMKNFEKNEESSIDTLNPSVSYDVTSDLANSENRNPDDMFLDELLKSEKIKRTSVPSKIEEQLRAIYQMLAEEKERRQKNIAEFPKIDGSEHIEEASQEIYENLSRRRRDTDKKFGDDPLGLRKEGLYRRRAKTEDVRDRRIDRRTRRRDKDDRKDGQPVIFDPKTAAVDSNENNFYGFHQREPLKGFPEGDLFLTTGTSSEETAKDYDYVRDDDADDQGKPRKTQKSGEPPKSQSDPDDTTWVEDENTQLSHVPHEFFEDVKMAAPRVQENLKEYGELWEAESLDETQSEHQDHFNAGDEEATVERIAQERQPDANEDKRAKETAVRKLIGYYENPRSHQAEDPDYFNPEKADRTRSNPRSLPRSITNDPRKQRPSQEFLTGRKRVKDVGSSEYGGFTDFDSMHFSGAPIASLEEEPLYDAGYPAARPAPRAKRSTDDLEMIMNQEMVFQDDNNLKDCECRVIRGARSSRRRGDRERGERRSKSTKAEARSERRRSRNRDGAPTSGPGGRFDEDYMHTTRTKRQIVSSEVDGDAGELIVDEPRVSIEYSSEESGSLAVGSDSGEVTELIDGPHREADQEVVDEDVVAVDEKTVDSDSESKNAESGTKNGIAPLKIEKEEPKTPVIEESGKLAAEEENASLTVDDATEDSIIDYNIVKRQNAAEVPIEKSTKDSEADQFFLDSKQDTEKNTTTFGKTDNLEDTTSTGGADQSLQDLHASSSEDKQGIVRVHSNSTETKVEASSTAISANTDKEAEEEDEKIGQRNDADSTTRAAEALLQDPEESILINKENNSTNIDVQAKLEDDEATTQKSKDAHKGIPDRFKLTKDNPRPPRKVQKTKPTVKTVDPVKTREARVAARSEALAALRKENDAKKAKKSLEATSKLLSTEHAKFQSMQKKRAEQLEKLRDKLRTKRAKMVQEYRDELLDELDKAANGEERNLKRREIIDMIKDDDELRDIVDREKLDYLILNKPINYDIINTNDHNDNVGLRKKYVPEIVEIVKPIHEVRERKVSPGQTIRYSNDPKLLAYASSDESTDSAAIRRALLEKIDQNNHKVKHRSGKIYYSVVESLENPRIYQYPDLNQESGEEDYDDSESVELKSDRTASSLKKYAEELEEKNYDEDFGEADEGSSFKTHQKIRRIPESEEEKVKYSSRLARTASDQDSKLNSKKYISKKKYLKESDYEMNSKYKSPKYARLVPEKSELEQKKFGHSEQKVKAYQPEMNDDEELQELTMKNLRKTKGNDDDIDSSLIDDKMEDLQQQFDLKGVEDLDLDEVLNSSKYELLMLIPVKNEKRSRVRRQVGNEIVRNEDDSSSNEIPVDIFHKKAMKTQPEDSNLGEIPFAEVENSQRTTLNDDDANSESSTVLLIESSNNHQDSTEKNGTDGFFIQEILESQSIPQSVSHNELRVGKDLPDLLEEAIPKLEETVNGGLGKARHISESFEKFIDDFDDRYKQKESEFDKGSATIVTGFPISTSFFSSATSNVKKFFDFISGIVHVFRYF